MIKRTAAVFVSILFSLALAEGALRVIWPAPSPSERIYSGLHYEPAPGARHLGRGWRERFNAEGFRGPLPEREKPAGTRRVLVLGDSVAQALEVPEAHSWPRRLERALNADGRRVEVLNGGVGGYVTRQAVRRFAERGIRYAPDVGVLSAGWNDLVYSCLPYWRPGLTLVDIERWFAASARGGRPAMDFLERRSRLFSMVRRTRSAMISGDMRRRILEERRKPSGIAFNEEALRHFEASLAEAHAAFTASGARFVLVLWPTVAARPTTDPSKLDGMLLQFQFVFPLSQKELGEWHARYQDAMRRFAAAHPDVVLVDVSARFDALPAEKRLDYFVDQAHLTVKGNALYADAVYDAISESLR